MKAYHYSPTGNRESILERGLMTRHPVQDRTLAERDGFRAGVYMFVDRRQAFLLDDGDVFEVDLTDTVIEPDPFHLDDPDLAIVSYSPIPPERIRWVGST